MTTCKTLIARAAMVAWLSAADPNGSGRKGFVDIDWFRVGR